MKYPKNLKSYKDFYKDILNTFPEFKEKKR